MFFKRKSLEKEYIDLNNLVYLINQSSYFGTNVGDYYKIINCKISTNKHGKLFSIIVYGDKEINKSPNLGNKSIKREFYYTTEVQLKNSYQMDAEYINKWFSHAIKC